MSLALLVYLIPNMVTLELFVASCGIPFLVVLLFLPESPRWLLVNRRVPQGGCLLIVLKIFVGMRSY